MKQQLRKRMLDIRKNMEREQVVKKSLRIKNRLFSSVEFSNACSILFYVSFKNEVDTIDMIQDSLALSKKVLVPICVTEHRDLILSEIKSLSELEEGKLGILEPKKEFVRPVDKKKVDLVLVPGLAFDLKGNRIGYGGGYYDRLLIKLKEECTKIGLAYEYQIVDDVPMEEHDVKLDIIMTEDRTVALNRREFL